MNHEKQTKTKIQKTRLLSQRRKQGDQDNSHKYKVDMHIDIYGAGLGLHAGKFSLN